jgi:hypothetical protein
MRNWFMRRLLERAAARLYHRIAREQYEADKVSMQYDPLVEWGIAGLKARKREICELLGGITSS